MTKKLTPGTKAPASGLYDIKGPRGRDTGVQRTVVKGEPFPPTPGRGLAYQLNTPANNGAGRGGKK
ncbi:hypothetical protein [Arthrobacter psychrochitiniphilus]|uniref:YjzC family protein n=1 Tax=Arthrobacter psychrochitiniphilus TaxID=291045 RepID=A0A2V3DLT6_9MICC|nr:hypothetical protein [Arthrobacter psychrochitiniphilus]NYG16006.1 hypothetical protein [Arthrobacter psychrochitiniphilus]PXA63892.1 hypothetical protein CVS29_17970 [Arthrobacter psychrochitiniphilus]